MGNAASPLLPQLLAVKLPLLLVDRVEVQYDQTDHHEEDGNGGHQHFQGQVDGVWLGAASRVVSCETEAAAIKKKEAMDTIGDAVPDLIKVQKLVMFYSP